MSTPVKLSINIPQNKSENLKDAFRASGLLYQNLKLKERTKNENSNILSNHENPDNLILTDDKYVYKIAPWNRKKNGKDFGIINEFKAYSILNSTNNYNIHVPEMVSCTIIEGTDFALLIITKNKEVSKNKLIQTNRNKLYNDASNYLSNKGIHHNDLLGNLYVVNKTFFIIDFEQATFTTNANEKINKKLLQEMTNSLKKNKKFVGFNSPYSPLKFFKKRGSIFDNNNNNNNSNNNNSNNRKSQTKVVRKSLFGNN